MAIRSGGGDEAAWWRVKTTAVGELFLVGGPCDDSRGFVGKRQRSKTKDRNKR